VRRLGRTAFFRDHDVDIYTYGEHTAADALNIDWTVVTPDDWNVQRKVRFFADACVPYHTGTFTAVQNINRATNTPQKVTDPTNSWAIPPVKAHMTPAGTNSTPDVYLLKITSGPRAGAAAWVANANNPIVGGQVRTSTWFIQNQNPALGGTIVSPQVGDQYICTQQRALYVDNVRVTGTVAWGGSYFCGVWFYNYEIFPNYGFDTQSAGRWQSFQISGGGCIVAAECFIQGASAWSGGDSNYSGSIYLSNCAGRDSTFFSGLMFALVDAGSYHLGVQASQAVYVALDAGVFGLTGAHFAYNGGHLIIADACSFDLPGHNQGGGFMAYSGGVIVTTTGWPSFYGNDAMWGALTCQYGVRVDRLSRWLLDPGWAGVLSVTGTDGPFCVGPVQTPGGPAQGVCWDPSPSPTPAWYSFESSEAPGVTVGTIAQNVASVAATTQPGIPRPMDVSFPAGWVGGTVTVNGTGRSGGVVSQTYTKPGGGGTVLGTVPFWTLTSFVNSAPAGGAGTNATISLHDGYAVPEPGVQAFLKVTVDGGSTTFDSTDLANGVFEPNAPHHGNHRVDVWYTFVDRGPPQLTTKRACTLANLRASISAGGFDYSVVDPTNDAQIIAAPGGVI
jgi:hypothetical protein